MHVHLHIVDLSQSYTLCIIHNIKSYFTEFHKIQNITININAHYYINSKVYHKVGLWFMGIWNIWIYH